MFAPLALDAGQSRTTIGVSAVVTDYTRVATLHQIDVLEIRGVDVRRGYVEVDHALGLEVRSNHPGGHRLVIENLDGFAGIDVLGLPQGPVTFSGPRASVPLPTTSVARVYDISYRLYFLPGQAPGSYPWPLTAFVEPN